ncbi:hypothetical protein AB1N83_008088 [Pleurotus pulmonarius]
MDCTSSTPRTPSPTDLHFIHAQDKKHENMSIFQPSLLQELYNDADLDSPYNDDPTALPQQQQHQQQQQQQVYRRATFPYVRHDREDIHLYPSTQPFLHHPHQHNFYPDSASYYPSSAWPVSADIPVKHEDQPQLIVPSHAHSLYNHQGFFPQHALPQQQQQQLPQQQQLHQHQQPLPPPLSYLPHSSMPVQHTDDAASKETQYLRRRCFNCHTTEPPSWRRSTLNPGKIVCNKCGLYERTHLRPRPLRFDELRAGNKARKNSNAAATQQQQQQQPARKESASPKVKGASVKKEPREYALPRRASVSSSASSASGASDWDDNLSVYSSPSAPPTSFNSPAVPSFPLARDSQSPPILDPSLSSLSPSLSSSLSHASLSSLPPLSDSSVSSSSSSVSSASSPSASSAHSLGGSPNLQGMIRLPNAPLSDIAAYSPHHHSVQLQQQQQLQSQQQYQQGGSPLSSPPLSGNASLPLHQQQLHLQQQQQQSYANYNGYNTSSTMSFAVQPMYGFDSPASSSANSYGFNSPNNNNNNNGMGTGLMGPPSPLSSIPSLPSTPSTPSLAVNNVTPTTRRRSSTSSSLAVSPQALSLGLGIAEEEEHEQELGQEGREGQREGKEEQDEKEES